MRQEWSDYVSQGALRSKARQNSETALLGRGKWGSFRTPRWTMVSGEMGLDFAAAIQRKNFRFIASMREDEAGCTSPGCYKVTFGGQAGNTVTVQLSPILFAIFPLPSH